MLTAGIIAIVFLTLILGTAPTPITVGQSGLPFGLLKEATKTTGYQVTAADNGTLFHTTGAAGSVTFTLPVVAAGLYYGFHSGANQNMVVIQGSDSANLISDGHLTGTTVTFSTASHLIGATALVRANAAGTAWEVYTPSAPAATMT